MHWTTGKKYESSSVILARQLTAFGMLVFCTDTKLLVFLVLFLTGLKIICPKGDSELFFQELFLIGHVFRKVLS